MAKKQQANVGQFILGVFGNLFRFIAILIMIGIMTGCIVVAVLTVYILRYSNANEMISIDDLSQKYTTILYAQNNAGETVELQRIQTAENRIWVYYDQIPRHTIDALVAIEDKRFWEHQGIDWKRTAAAAINMFIPILPSQQGGSTITQQLIKNVTGDNAVRVDRKVREIFRAIKLEQNYSKEQILEAYLNTVYYSNNCYGVQAAANVYFGKDVSELTVAESAAIVGITQYPGRWDPFANPENNKQRQEDVLWAMLEQSFLTQEEYDEAVAQELDFRRDAAYERVYPVYSYFVDHVIEEVIADLQEQYGYTYEEAQAMVNSGGLRITTTVDTEVQDYLTEFYANVENFPAIYNETYPQSATVITDINGAIKGIAGGIGEKEGMREFSRATMSRRQPGSSIKPLAAYLQAFENDVVTWSTKIDDSPITLADGTSWPLNFQRNYIGLITIDQAIQQSRNTIPVKLVQNLTPRRCFDFLRDKLAFTSLVEREVGADGRIFSDIDLSPMALGGMQHGVTPLEMAGGYQIFANGGYFTEPYAYTLVTDFDGNVLLEQDVTPRRVITPETATIMNRLLQRVTAGPWGTGTTARWDDQVVAGKTGTSSDDFDQWFIGCTPYYVCAVWMGYDENETIRYQYYPPPLVFRSIMSHLHENLEAQEFPVWGDVVEMQYCADSGELAIAGCPSGGVGFFKAENLPPECTFHSGAMDSIDLGDGLIRFEDVFDRPFDPFDNGGITYDDGRIPLRSSSSSGADVDPRSNADAGSSPDPSATPFDAPSSSPSASDPTYTPEGFRIIDNPD